MSLTPDDVVSYPLKQSMRGYSVSQVDELLDKVADELDRLNGEVDEARTELVRCRQRAEEAGETEATLKRTLVTAQRAAEQSVAEARERSTEIVDAARREAAGIVEEARLEAEGLRTESLQAARAEEAELRRRRQSLEERIDGLRRFERDMVARLREWLEEQMHSVQELHARRPEHPNPPGGEGDRSLGEGPWEIAGRRTDVHPEPPTLGRDVDDTSAEDPGDGHDDAGGDIPDHTRASTRPDPDDNQDGFDSVSAVVAEISDLLPDDDPEPDREGDSDPPGAVTVESSVGAQQPPSAPDAGKDAEDQDSRHGEGAAGERRDAGEGRGLFDELALRARSWTDTDKD